MSAVDFEAWAMPALELTLGGRTYTVQPPSVEDSKKLIAAAVRAEVNLGIVKGEIPDEVQRVLDSIQPGEHPALGSAYDQMVADGVNPTSIDRMAYYAVFFWARGKTYADFIALTLWAPREEAKEASKPGPKARTTSAPKSGRRTGSANRSTTTRTGSRSTRTTGSRKKS